MDVLQQEVKKCKVKTLAELAKDKHCTVIRVAQEEVFHQHQRDNLLLIFAKLLQYDCVK